jgi:CrcB protein
MVQAAYAVGVGGAVGAICRYAIGSRLTHDRIPVGTLAVNVLGSFLLGLVVFGGLGGDLSLFFAVGFCGSLTTYSSFSVDTVQLWTAAPRRSAIYVLLMSVSCLFAVGLAAGIVLLG